VSVCLQGLDADVFVDYDSGEAAKRKVFRFRNVCSVYKASFPGPVTITPPLDRANIGGGLMELLGSEQARAWTEHFGAGEGVRHYRIVFLAENLLVEVFGSEVIVEDVLGQV